VGTSKHDRHRGYKRQHSDHYQSSNSYKRPFYLKGHKKPGYKEKTATPTQDRRLEIRQTLHLLKQQVRISTTLDYNRDFNIDFTSIRNRFQSNCQTFKAGNLAHYLSCWKDFTCDKDILSCVAGLRIDFNAKPRLPRLYVPTLSVSEQLAIDNELTKLAEKQVIEPTGHDPEEIISSIFVRPKKDGSHRLILNLKRLNMFSPKVHFKMDTLHTVLKLVQRHCYMASIDLKDSVRVAKTDRKYLRFLWNDKLYQYTCMPNGLSCAPRKFTKLLKPSLSKRVLLM